MSLEMSELNDERRSALLSSQAAMQATARQLVRELDLHTMLAPAGVVSEHGSSISGLMAWRDVDFGVTSPGLTPARAFEIMMPLLQDPRTSRVRYQNETGSRIFMGDPRNERIFFMVNFDGPDGESWKIDVAFWLWPEPRGEGDDTATLRARLTDETRAAILWIKSLWHSLAAYPAVVGSVDIYTAVLDHGVRSPAEFDQYLTGIGKPTLSEAALLPGTK